MPEIADWLKTLGMSEYAERSGEGKERGVVGETLNLAARLQALAEPNAVVIRPQTQRLLGNPFEHHDLGAVEMRAFRSRCTPI
jgi:class 3 adenylate cyclase